MAATQATKFRILGAVCLVLYLLAGVAFTLNVQLIGVGTGQRWNKPYLESYAYHMVWVLVFPLAWLALRIETRYRGEPLPPLPWKRLFVWGGIAGPLIVLMSWVYYLSLARMSLSVNSAINNSGFLLVFCASVVFLKEKITVLKLAGCVLAIGGLVMVVFGSKPLQDDHATTVSGFIFLGIEMLGNTIYNVLYSKVMGPMQQEWGVSSVLGFFSIAFMGAFALGLMWVGVVIGHVTGLEPFALPTGPALTEALISMGADFVLNLFYLLGILFTSGTFMSVGALFGIATNTIVQRVFLGTTTLLPLGFGGVALIVSGCLLFELNEPLWVVVLQMHAAVLRRCGAPVVVAPDETETAPLLVNEDPRT